MSDKNLQSVSSERQSSFLGESALGQGLSHAPFMSPPQTPISAGPACHSFAPLSNSQTSSSPVSGPYSRPIEGEGIRGWEAGLAESAQDSGESFSLGHGEASIGWGPKMRGVDINGSALSASSPKDQFAGVQADLLKAEARAFQNEDETTVGLSADLASLTGHLGSFSPDSNRDSQFIAGTGVGLGFGATVHHSDDDNDGIKEYGLSSSVALGPLGTLGYKSEDLIGDAVDVVPILGPAMRHFAGEDSNYTQNTIEAASKGIDWASEKGGAAVDWTAEKGGAAMDWAAEKGRATKEWLGW